VTPEAPLAPPRAASGEVRRRPALFPSIATRKLGSLLTGLSFLVVAVSGVLSFAARYTDKLAGVHTIAGFTFLAAAAIHVSHNATTWLRYTRARGRIVPSKSFVVALAASAVALYASCAGVRPVMALLQWGKHLRADGTPPKTTYEKLVLDVSGQGPLLSLDVKAGPFFQFTEPTYGFHITPQIAVWTTDEDGKFGETLYVTRDEGRAGYDEGDEKHTLSPRPAALPVWSHLIGVQHGDTPLHDRHAPVPDVVSAASPTDNVYLVARAHETTGRFAVVLELNSSFDYNDYYRLDSFPDEIAYADGGNPAQPSVVYRGWVEAGSSAPVVMVPIGHGHHAGANGEIDPDLSHLTTALQIVDRVVIDVRRAPGAAP
jgi:hypothetical protein